MTDQTMSKLSGAKSWAAFRAVLIAECSLPEEFDSDPDSDANDYVKAHPPDRGRFNTFDPIGTLNAIAGDITALSVVRDAAFHAEIEAILYKLRTRVSDATATAYRGLLANSDRSNWAGGQNTGDWDPAPTNIVSDQADLVRHIIRLAAEESGHPLNWEQRAKDARSMYGRSLAIVYDRVESARLGLKVCYGINDLASTSSLSYSNPPQQLQGWLEEASRQISLKLRYFSSSSSILLVGGNGFAVRPEPGGPAWPEFSQFLNSISNTPFKFPTHSLWPSRDANDVRLVGIGAALCIGKLPESEDSAEWQKSASLLSEIRALTASWQIDIDVSLPAMTYETDSYSDKRAARVVRLNRVGVVGPGDSLASIPTVNLGADTGLPIPSDLEISIGGIIRSVHGAFERGSVPAVFKNKEIKDRLSFTDLVLVLDVEYTPKVLPNFTEPKT